MEVTRIIMMKIQRQRYSWLWQRRCQWQWQYGEDNVFDDYDDEVMTTTMPWRWRWRLWRQGSCHCWHGATSRHRRSKYAILPPCHHHPCDDEGDDARSAGPSSLPSSPLPSSSSLSHILHSNHHHPRQDGGDEHNCTDHCDDGTSSRKEGR